MFKFIISLLVTFIAVPAMASTEFKNIELAGTGMQYCIPTGWVEGKLFKTSLWHEPMEKVTDGFAVNINWQVIPVDNDTPITVQSLRAEFAALKFEPISITEEGKNDFHLDYKVEKFKLFGEKEVTVVFKQRIFILENSVYVVTLTTPENRLTEVTEIWNTLQKLTPVPVIAATKEPLSVTIGDLEDLISTKRSKLERLELLDRSKDQELREALGEELEVLGLRLRKLQRENRRNESWSIPIPKYLR